MENFCLYNGKKIAKLETWDITSVELSSDYTSAIIQAESKRNKSEYTLDVTHLISNQYKNGLDPYTATIVNELTGVSDWILDSDNNQIKYRDNDTYGVFRINSASYTCKSNALQACAKEFISFKYPQLINNKYEAKYSRYSDYQVNVFNPPPQDKTTVIQFIITLTSPVETERDKTLPLPTVAQQVISNAESGDSAAQNSIISIFNNVTDDILTSDYSEFFEQNKQPK